MMPDFPFHWHSKDKPLAFLVLRHKPIISFVCKIDCHRLFKRLKSILAIASIHRHRHSRLPTDNSGFSCFKTSFHSPFQAFRSPLAVQAFLVSRRQPINLKIDEAFQTTETYPYHACIHGMVNFPTRNKKSLSMSTFIGSHFHIKDSRASTRSRNLCSGFANLDKDMRSTTA